MALIGAGRIVDREFDKARVTFKTRFSVAGGGYPIFCFVVCLIAISILVFDAERSSTYVPFLTWTFAILNGGSILGLLMTDKGSLWWIVGAAVGFFGFLLAPQLIHSCA
jgi:hypothetical protein